MNIEKILKYQELDGTKLRISSQAAESESAREYKKAVESMKRSKEETFKANMKAAEKFAEIEKLREKYAVAAREIEELEKETPNIGEDIKQAEFYESSLQKLASALEQIDSECKAAVSELKRLGAKGTESIANANRCASLAKKFKQDFEANMESEKSRIAEINKEQKELEAEIEPELLEKYKEARKHAKYPFVVKLGGSNMCGGCMITLSMSDMQKFDNGEDFVVCPDCNRLIYKPRA